MGLSAVRIAYDYTPLRFKECLGVRWNRGLYMLSRIRLAHVEKSHVYGSIEQFG